MARLEIQLFFKHFPILPLSWQCYETLYLTQKLQIGKIHIMQNLLYMLFNINVIIQSHFMGQILQSY